MSIKLGFDTPKDLKLGTINVQELRLGRNLVWSRDTFPEDAYDAIIPMPSSGEIDLLYTTDIHDAWYGFNSATKGTPVFSLSRSQTLGQDKVGGDVKYYQEKLIENNIPTYLIDCGDWAVDGRISSQTITTLQNMDYFAMTYGNHEWKAFPSKEAAMSHISSMEGHGLLTMNYCSQDSSGNYNPIYAGNNKIVELGLSGCRAIKVGDYKIGIIALGFPSANGSSFSAYDSNTFLWKVSGTSNAMLDSVNDETRQAAGTTWNEGGAYEPYRDYEFHKGNIYTELQRRIDLFKITYSFDYVIAFGHIDIHNLESFGDRLYTFADYIIQNTIGLDVFIPGHSNQIDHNQYAKNFRDNTRDVLGRNMGFVAAEAGANMNAIGRLKIDLTNTTGGVANNGIYSKLLTTTNQLSIIDFNNL